MKTALALLLILSSFPLMASLIDDCSVGVLEEFIDYSTTIVGAVDVQETMAEGKKWLELNKDRKDFTVVSAEALIKKLTAITEDNLVVKGTRSQAFVLMAGIHGRIADKLQSNGGTAHGKKALSSLKSAIAVDSTNQNAGKAYGMTIQRMINKNMITRKLIESSMGMNISLSQEAKEAAKVLESMGLTGLPAYKDLKDF